MKKRIPSFFAGALTTALICGLTVSALAATGLFTIDVDPNVNIMVNGEVFKPKNEQGEDVLLFNYGGTVYAPVRALAKAYGLEVNWDPNANMASVAEPAAPTEPTTPPDTTATLAVDYSDWTAEEEAAYQEFKAMWKVELYEAGNDVTDGHEYCIYHVKAKDIMTIKELGNYVRDARIRGFVDRFIREYATAGLESKFTFCSVDHRGVLVGAGDYTIYEK